jgi:lipopolysaccharide export system permease protein
LLIIAAFGRRRQRGSLFVLCRFVAPRNSTLGFNLSIFQRSITKEFSAIGMAVISVLVAIMVLQQLVRLLRDASSGVVEPEAVMALMGFAMLGYLPVLLALALFIGVLLALSRSYRDSEMPVWFSSGLSLTAWIKPVLRFGLPIALLTGLLSLFLTPWALSQSAEYKRILRSKDDVARLSPGSFIESRATNRIFFVDNTSSEAGVLSNIFVVQYSVEGRPGIVVAESAFQKIEANGDKFVVLKNGRDYEGTPGQLDFRIIEFDTQKIRVEEKEVKAEIPNSKQTSTWSLLTEHDAVVSRQAERLAEIHWRVALPIAALVLALMAVPLSFVNPRAGASANLFMAVLIFFLYYTLLGLFQKWTENGQISPWIGLWPVHIGMIATLLVLFSRQLFSFRWLVFARQ